MTILAVLMTFVYQIVHPGSREIRRAEAEVATQQAALLSLQQSVGETSLSDHRSVLADGQTLSFLSSEPLRNLGTPTLASENYEDTGVRGTPDWTKFVLYYRDDSEDRVYRKEFPYSGGREVSTLKSDRINSLIADRRYLPRRIAGGVASFLTRQVEPDRFVLEITSSVSGMGEMRSTSLSLQFTTRNTL